jgi:hypothetical protein
MIFENDIKQQFSGLGHRIQTLFPKMDYRQILEQLQSNGFKVEYENIRRYILNERRPDWEFLVKLARLKKISVDWLLTGEEEVKIAEDDQKFWNRLSATEMNALNEFSRQRNYSLGESAHWLVRDGLYAYENLRNESTFKFFPQFENSRKKDIEIWGSIHDGELFTPAPAKKEVVQVPGEVYPKQLEKGTNYHSVFFHAYRVETDEFEPVGVRRGNLFICGYQNRFGYDPDHLGSAILLQAGGGTRLLLRRYYFDHLRRKYYVFAPLIGRARVERHEDTNATNIEIIHGVITD